MPCTLLGAVLPDPVIHANDDFCICPDKQLLWHLLCIRPYLQCAFPRTFKLLSPPTLLTYSRYVMFTLGEQLFLFCSCELLQSCSDHRIQILYLHCSSGILKDINIVSDDVGIFSPHFKLVYKPVLEGRDGNNVSRLANVWQNYVCQCYFSEWGQYTFII